MSKPLFSCVESVADSWLPAASWPAFTSRGSAIAGSGARIAAMPIGINTSIANAKPCLANRNIVCLVLRAAAVGGSVAATGIMCTRIGEKRKTRHKASSSFAKSCDPCKLGPALRSVFVSGLDDVAVVRQTLERGARYLGIYKTLGHSPKARLVVTMIEVRS